MRSVLSVSIPAATLRRLKKKAKDKDMTVSAYLVRLVDEEETLISEDELLKDIRQGRKDYKAGRVKTMGPDDKVEDFFPLTK